MTQFSIPVAVRLTSESTWEKLDDRQTLFGIARFHFYLDDASVDGKAMYGEPIGVYRKPKGVKLTRTESETTTLETIESHKSIENYLMQREELRELAIDILGKYGVTSIFAFGASIRKRVVQKLGVNFSLGEEIGSSLKSTTTRSITISNELSHDFDEELISVPAYVRRAVHIHLTHIDFLRVHYRRTQFGLRKKAKSEPAVVDFQRHPNRIEAKVHIATALYWQLLPTSSCFLLAKDYEQGVSAPTEVVMCAPESVDRKFVNFPRVPTLYQIARAAFPKKWVWRKSENREWTEKELMEIELDEVRGRPGWWGRHGPGSL